ncbi:mitochondrial ribosomal death-associated protein 3-domain-containing protein [Chaetomidium leptoderma]|uniref:Small ribosomal subunit protein mS29 n=1 Tax=Chaetomidium leptoderma TaxID=669021 RepID=A0AAN6VWJ4_9PEZI|nr:mitochondrial ribosomal death-associated protein 3-domain-containing protein [Chaetomidium leptoderma]
MSAPNCLRCLVRPSAGIPVSAPRTVSPLVTPFVLARTAPFSTTAANARPKKEAQGKSDGGGSSRGGKKLQLGKFKKEKVADRGRTPLPGERKAYRKRITLSNDNAIPVPWLTDLGPADLADPRSSGKVMALPEEVQDQLRASEAFKATQCWGMFRKPAVLVRKETTDLVNRMEDAVDKKETLRLVVTGDKVTGKSMMLLQAMTHAYLNNWIVIHVPEAQELTTACTDYAPIPNTDPVQYMQNVYVLKLIQAIKRANEKVLAKTYTMTAHPELPQNMPANSSLLALANVAKEAEGAWAVFQALWTELTAQGANRPPILLTLDGLAHVMKVSDYRAPSFDLIHSHDLALVRLFSDVLAGGGAKFPSGGAVLAATSRSNAPRAASMELALAQREAEQSNKEKEKTDVEVPKKDPFFRGYDDRVEAVLRSVQVLRLKGIDKLEARALMEYWAASGMLRAMVDEKTVTEKWTLAGSGVLGEMERAALLTMRV